ncbi:aminoglycoside phosphotransferase family protein [bacterium]|nr:aminoglycoside phosphotransferase family protein [bacterium]
MNKANKLLDKDFVLNLLKEKVLPLYPNFVDIKSFALKVYKDHIWEGDTYHVVIEYRTRFIADDGKVKILPIFCSAHSNEPRKNVYDSLKFLWKSGFSKGYLSIPHPLFYSEYFNGTFYRGVEGKNLYQYIREKDSAAIESIIVKAAKWFAKLHKLPINNIQSFSEINSRIETVFPGIKHLLERIKRDYPKYLPIYREIYDILISEEKKFFNSTDKRWLVHGDAHPENIIRMSQHKLAVIDFTDLCVADFTRDLGTFVQQLDFMTSRKLKDKGYSKKLAQLFLDSYFSVSKEKFNKETEKRINNYYYWTAMRTATYFLIAHNPEPERAYPMLKQVYSDFVQAN